MSPLKDIRQKSHVSFTFYAELWPHEEYEWRGQEFKSSNQLGAGLEVTQKRDDDVAHVKLVSIV